MAMAEVTVSDRALQHVARALESEADGAFLRVSVEGGGCSGFQYQFTVDTQLQDDDITLGTPQTRVVVDAISLPFLAGAQIDYVEDLMGSAFRINNPNAKASCGCGTSFTV